MVKNRTSLLILAVVFMTACSIVTPTPDLSPSIDIYTLESDSTEIEMNVESTATDAITLALDSIRSSRSFMATDIIYREKAYSYNSYTYSRWEDSPTKLVAFLLQQSLQKSKHIAAVIPVGSSSKADLLLEATLLDFSHHVNGDGTSTGVVTAIFYLVEPNTKIVLANKEFTSTIEVEQHNAMGAATAINKASNEMAASLRIWLESFIAQHYGK